MEEKELIKQLKTLKAIKPAPDWVALTKKGLLVEEEKTRVEGFFPNVFALFGSHALVFSAVALVGLVVLGGLFYSFVGDYKDLEGLLARVISQNSSSEQMLVSLGELQGKLEGVKMAMDNLKNAKDQNQALAMTEIVKATAKQGKEVAEKIKNTEGDLSKQVLASLVAVEGLSEELGQKSATLQKEIFEKYLQDLKQRSLGPEDRERLKKAEELWSQGKEGEAMILLSRIGSK